MDEAQIAQLRAEAARAKAEAARAEAEAAEAALAAALAEAGTSPATANETDAAVETPADSSAAPEVPADTALAQAANPVQVTSDERASGKTEATGETDLASEAAEVELSDYARTVAGGYSTENALQIGVLLEGETPVASVPVTLPLPMLNRHGLIAGATGTGKTRTLQLIAEGLSNAGVPVFLTDIKGDLTGLLEKGTASEGLLARVSAQGQAWEPSSFPTDMFALGGIGDGVPVRATVTDFGPLLLSRVLDLNDTQESALSLIFAWADSQEYALVDLQDLRSVVSYLTEEGKEELKTIGGIATSTAGVILREIAALQAQGGDEFFGEPAFDTKDFFRVVGGRGVISLLELPELSNRPALFSTFVMWLLAELFETLPEVGDTDKPKLVFFFDEAHLLFNGASKAFLNAIVTTVRLIRSKGVGVFFITQTPKDIPADVLAQLGAKIQHALRAHTPNDQKALRETVKTFPTSPLDLEEVLPGLGTGEAIVTVLDRKGRPSPVAPTRLWAPAALMGPASADTLAAHASELAPRYGERVDPESAHELLTARIQAEQAAAEAAARAEEERKAAENEAQRTEKEAEKARQQAIKEAEKEAARIRKEADRARERAARAAEKEAERSARTRRTALDSFLRSASSQIGRQIGRSIFGNRRR